MRAGHEPAQPCEAVRERFHLVNGYWAPSASSFTRSVVSKGLGAGAADLVERDAAGPPMAVWGCGDGRIRGPSGQVSGEPWSPTVELPTAT